MQKRSYFLALLWRVLEKIAKVLLAFMSEKRNLQVILLKHIGFVFVEHPIFNPTTPPFTP